MTTRPKNWRQDLIQVEVEEPTVEIKLTESDLNFLIEDIEVDEEIFKQGVEEGCEHCRKMLDLLTRLRKMRGDF